ncbi:hypothetical protein OF846_005048 [Rhodotorula toruloides]|nr:hypothetical protein OF846_005048 [Rhodotorula toruloides]
MNGGTRRVRLRLVAIVAAIAILLWAVHRHAFSHGATRVVDYRRHLEEFHAADNHDVRPNLGFDHVYVVSLARRDDRRQIMSKLAAAHNLRLTFIDALPFESSVVGWIAERVAEVRRMKRGLLGKGLQLPQNSLGGQDIDSCWLIPSVSVSPAPHLQLLIDPFYPNLEGFDLPSLADERFGGQDWAAHLNAKMAQSRLEDLKPSRSDVNVTDIMLDPVEKFINRQTNEGTIACWHSHMQAVQTIIDNGDSRALILEDDVDFEWDLERTWAAIARWLPERGERRRSAYEAAAAEALPPVHVESYDADGEEQWHSVFLGHCWGRESERPHYFHPMLYRSVSPRCTHAYALSAEGATHLRRVLSDPWTAYQTAIDTAYAALIMRGGLNSFSVEPPLIVQAKTLASDVHPGLGSKWRGRLADSTLERIMRDEGLDVPEPTEQEVMQDAWAQNFRQDGLLPEVPFRISTIS